MKTSSVAIPEINALAKKIQDEILEGKQRVEIAVENERTITYWKIGKHINEHLLEYQDRAGYGDELFKKIAEKLRIGQRTLYSTVEFYQKYPNILQTFSKLGWSHYITLLSVKSEEKRKELERKVIESDLSVRDLKKIIKKNSVNKIDKQAVNFNYSIERGIPFIYKLKYKKNDNSKLRIDCGFKFFTENFKKEILKYNENDIIRVKKKNNKYIINQFEINDSNIYTYQATVEEILDGDTIWMDIGLGFGNFSRQKLRLRNINAPDINTQEGQKVKDYIASRLNPCKFVIIRTHYRDKFTRYIVDIFYDKNITDEYELAEKGKLLNLELLENKLVLRY